MSTSAQVVIDEQAHAAGRYGLAEYCGCRLEQPIRLEFMVGPTVATNRSSWPSWW
jgi:hypothetical protein